MLAESDHPGKSFYSVDVHHDSLGVTLIFIEEIYTQTSLNYNCQMSYVYTTLNLLIYLIMIVAIVYREPPIKMR